MTMYFTSQVQGEIYKIDTRGGTRDSVVEKSDLHVLTASRVGSGSAYFWVCTCAYMILGARDVPSDLFTLCSGQRHDKHYLSTHDVVVVIVFHRRCVGPENRQYVQVVVP